MDNIEKIEVFLGLRPLKGDAKEVGWRAESNTPGIHPGIEQIGPQEASKRLRDLANHIDAKTEPVPPDHNMILALQMASHLVPNVPLPASIAAMTPDQVADLVEVVDKEPVARLPVSRDDYEPFTRVAVLLGRIGTMSAPLLPDVPDSLQRINLVLRMWSASTITGKTIDEKTKSGPNDIIRRMANAGQIESIAAADQVFEAGIVASLIIKRRRGEKCHTDWIPDGTRLARLKAL
jgi:hypothetical protein